MKRAERVAQTREDLLDAGVRAFITQGYHGTGLKEVLSQVGVPKGSFYNYFASKEEFGAVVIRHYSECLGQKMARALEQEGDPLVGLRAFFERLIAEFEADGHSGGCLVANLGGELEGSEVCRSALQAAWRDWRDAIARVLEEAQGLGDVRTDLSASDLADAIVEAWEGAVIRMKIERSTAPLERCLDRMLGEYVGA